MRTLETWEQLHGLIGKVSEAADIDFKEPLSPKDPKLDVKLAKDIAALANSLGGHLIIGATAVVKSTQCSGFVGVDETTAGLLVEVVERAARDRCRPTPFVSTHLIDVPNTSNRVLVLQVQMSPVAPVGACEDPQSGGKSTPRLWTFPYRVGSETAFLSPDQFGAYESMSARRAAALLGSIELNSKLVIRWSDDERKKPTPNQSRTATFEGFDLAKNVVWFRIEGSTSAEPTIWVPLDDVSSVWRGKDNLPVVALRGTISFGGVADYSPAC